LSSRDRVALAVERFEEAVALYSCGLGLHVRQAWKAHSGRGVLLDADSATLELLSTGASNLVDRIEVGRPAYQAIRLAFGVDDSAEMARILASGGATVLGGPVETPWGHRNVRLRAPDGPQITLFSVLSDSSAGGCRNE
jgi:catechol 2,3-dioxygenase-like lactoylglutathione lyase family enzyme